MGEGFRRRQLLRSSNCSQSTVHVGNGSYGKLGHGGKSRKYDCEFVPRRVEYLQHTVIGSVVCGDRNLFAFAPTCISEIAPVCGEHVGGYELRIRGSGFWPSDNMTVRFVPLNDGRLMRGMLGTFNEATGRFCARCRSSDCLEDTPSRFP